MCWVALGFAFTSLALTGYTLWIGHMADQHDAVQRKEDDET